MDSIYESLTELEKTGLTLRDFFNSHDSQTTYFPGELNYAVEGMSRPMFTRGWGNYYRLLKKGC